MPRHRSCFLPPALALILAAPVVAFAGGGVSNLIKGPKPGHIDRAYFGKRSTRTYSGYHDKARHTRVGDKSHLRDMRRAAHSALQRHGDISKQVKVTDLKLVYAGYTFRNPVPYIRARRERQDRVLIQINKGQRKGEVIPVRLKTVFEDLVLAAPSRLVFAGRGIAGVATQSKAAATARQALGLTASQSLKPMGVSAKDSTYLFGHGKKRVKVDVWTGDLVSVSQ